MKAEYGKTIRQLRLSKGYSQKEIYTGIVSKSYAIEFEKGQHEMGLNNLLQVLSRLAIEIGEFLFIHHDYQLPLEKSYFNQYSVASNASDEKTLRQLLKLLTPLKQESAQIVVALITLHFITTECPYPFSSDELPEKEVNLLTTYLLKVDSWTHSELVIFISAIGFLPFETQTTLMASATKRLKKYRDYKSYDETMGALLVNYISEALIQHEQGLTTHYLAQLQIVAEPFNMSHYRQLALFYEGIRQILWVDYELGLKKCQTVIDFLAFQGLTNWQESLTNNLMYHLNIKRISD